MRILVVCLGLVLFVSGCVSYARLEQIELGMSVDEVSQITTCFYRGQSTEYFQYSCKIDVPAGQNFEKRTVKPYVFTFQDGKLIEISLDEKELDREAVRSRHDHCPYGYRYHYYYRY